MSRMRRPRARLNVKVQSSDVLSEMKSLGWKEPDPSPLYGYEKKLSGPIFQNLSNRIPVVRDHSDADVKVYAERKPRRYTITGSFVHKDEKVNRISSDAWYKDVPHVEDVHTMDDLENGSFTVFIDMHAGRVYAVISAYDRKTIKWWERYSSFLPRPIERMSGKQVRTMCAQPRQRLMHGDEPVVWLSKIEMQAYLRGPRCPTFNDTNWHIEKNVSLQWPTVKDGIPDTVTPEYLRQYNFRYGTFKEG